jgi:heterodisulfide reductase subunit B
MRYAYFPGCTLRSSGRDYHLSFKTIAEVLGIELVELKDWVCCGATLAPSISRFLAVALPAMNLLRAEKEGFARLITPCPACLSRFKRTNHELKGKGDLRARVNEILTGQYQATVKPYHPLEAFLELGLDRIRQRVRKKLSGLRIACYYGCLLTRPADVAQFDSVENPQSLDSIVRILGAEPVEWSFKTECCGSAMTLTHSEMVLKLSNEILKDARDAGAQAIAVACPLCHTNLDSRQGQIEEKYQTTYNIPIFYITQLMGLAFGAYPREMGIHRLITSPQEVLGAVGLV